MLFFNDLALSHVSCKSLKFQSLLFSIPTAPTKPHKNNGFHVAELAIRGAVSNCPPSLGARTLRRRLSAASVTWKYARSFHNNAD